MLLDTSGLYCFLDADDPLHAQTSSLLDRAPVRITHNYVLAKLIALCNARGFNRKFAQNFVAQIAADPEVDFVWIEKSLHDGAVSLLQQRQDKDYSLCDAVSFLLMRQRAIHEALTTDRHFEQEGFVRLLSYERP